MSCVSVACRGPGFTINGQTGVSTCPRYPQVNPFNILCSSLLPSLDSLPSLCFCSNRRPKPLPRVQLNFAAALLLLLSGDVSLNPGPTRNLRLGTVNVRSIRDKGPVLSDLVVSRGLDVLGVTETWLTTSATQAELAEVTPPGYSLFQIPRERRRGGGGRLVRLTFPQIFIY